jgi:hypothetical protein
VVFPSLLFVSVWLAGPILAWRLGAATAWIILSCLIGVTAATLVSIATYPLFQAIASKGKGMVRLEHHTLCWQVGGKQHVICLNQPYLAAVAVDTAAGGGGRTVLVEVENKRASMALYWTDVPADKVQDSFPAPYFIQATELLAKDSAPGFDLDGTDPSHLAFLEALLSSLWQTRHQNARFQTYSRFPWDVQPQPEYKHILVIDRSNPSPAERDLLAQEEPRTLFCIDTLRLSPNYVLDVEEEAVCAMPLGFVRTELEMGSRGLYDAVANMSPTLRFVGRDSRGRTLRFDIPLFSDKLEELRALVRFVNWCHEKRSL